MITKGAEELIKLLTPVLEKLVDAVNSKLPKNKEEKKKDDDDKDEKKGKKSTQVGDFVGNWRFEKTEIGKKFGNDLGKEDAKSAVETLGQNITEAMESAVEKRLTEGAKKLIGEKANFEIVQEVLGAVAEKAVKIIKKFTTIMPLIKQAKSFFDVREKLEEKLKEAKGKGNEEVMKVIDEGSYNFWNTLPEIGMNLFRDMDSLKENIKSEFSGISEDSMKPLMDVCDRLYTKQVKCFDAIRTRFVTQLKAKIGANLGSDDAVAGCIRTTYRDATMEVINIIVAESWTDVSGGIMGVAAAMVLDKFKEVVWDKVKSVLEPIQSLIPDQLAKLGLEIEPMAWSIVEIIITKASNFAVAKLVIKLEEILYNQAVSL